MIDEQEVIRLYTQEHLAMAVVAERVGTYPVRVMRILNKNNVPTRQRWSRPIRRCNRCSERKPLEEFHKNKNMPLGHGYTCKKCEVDYRRENWQHLKQYGITRDDYDAMLSDQGGVCAVCKTPGKTSSRSNRMAVDHDHQTGRVRGLLCGRCNTLISKLDESPGWIISALKYLGK